MKYTLLFLCTLFLSCSQDALIDKVDTSNDDFFEDGEVDIIFENDPTNGINVIFLGDAYVKENLGHTYGSYRNDGRESIKALFETSPFSEYKEHFNAYIVYVESNSDEITILDAPPTDTAFGSTLQGGGPNGLSRLTITDYANMRRYAEKATKSPWSERDVVLMSVNNAGRGSAQLLSNVAVFGGGNTLTMLHEVGHAFASLGDEYFFEGLTNTASTDLYPNLDRTDILKVVKWNHLIGLDGYGRLGTYEGGLYTPTGVWRPKVHSLMRSHSEFQSFNAPSREAIVKRILALRNIEYNFETFLEIDQLSIENINSGRSLQSSPTQEINCGNMHGLQ